MSTGFVCPNCHHQKSGVNNSRPRKEGVWRGRHCLSCGHHFTTYETIYSPAETKKIITKIIELAKELKK